MVHLIKIDTQYFQDVIEGRKRFEIRKNDRGYKQDDVLVMKEVRCFEETGRACVCTVLYILDDQFYLRPGYICMSIQHMNLQHVTYNDAEIADMISHFDDVSHEVCKLRGDLFQLDRLIELLQELCSKRLENTQLKDVTAELLEQNRQILEDYHEYRRTFT